MQKSLRASLLERVGALLRCLLGYPPVRIIIGFVALVMVLDSRDPGSAQGSSPGVMQTLVTVALLFAVYASVVFLIEGRPISELGLRTALPHLFAGVLLGVVVSSSHLARLLAVMPPHPVMLSIAGGYLLAATIPAVSEELICRGIVLRVSEEWLGTLGALLLSALIFSFLHPPQIRGDTFMAGLALGACFIFTRRLWVSIGGHFAHNAMLDILSGGRSKELEAAGPTLGSVILLGLPSVLVAVVLLVLAQRMGCVKPPFTKT